MLIRSRPLPRLDSAVSAFASAPAVLRADSSYDDRQRCPGEKALSSERVPTQRDATALDLLARGAS
jgi:hypothetical protein